MKLRSFLALVGAGLAVLALMGGGAVAYWQSTRPEPAPQPVHTPAPPVAEVPAVAPAPPTPAPAVEPVGRPVDQVVLGFVGTDLGSAKRKDVTKGKPFKVNVYQDEGHSTANRAKVDLDRDDKWDEKFTFDGDAVSRKVAPADDEDYTQVFVWSGSEWVAAE